MIPPLKSRPFRVVFKWQAIATLAIAVIAGAVAGLHGAVSAVLGGLVNFIAGLVFGLILGLSLGRTTGAAMSMLGMLRAEAAKVAAIVLQLWLVLSMYEDVVPAAFFSSFVVTVIVFSLAFFVSE